MLILVRSDRRGIGLIEPSDDGSATNRADLWNETVGVGGGF